MILEDNSGRVSLGGLIKPLIPYLATGVVIAVKGQLNDGGEFEVSMNGIIYKLRCWFRQGYISLGG